MYDNVDINQAIEFIVNKIYQNPKFYFEGFIEKPEHFPSKSTILALLRGCLRDFTGFSSRVGNFKQNKGVNMGGSISPIVANIFCSLIENNIVSSLTKSGECLLFARFVDDCIIVCEKIKTQNFQYVELSQSKFPVQN